MLQAFSTKKNERLETLQTKGTIANKVSTATKTIAEAAKSPQLKYVAAAFAVTGIGAPIAVCLGIIALVAEAITIVDAYHEMKDYMNELSIVVQGFFQILVLSQQFNSVCQLFLQKKEPMRALYIKSMADLTKTDWETFDRAVKKLIPAATPDVTNVIVMQEDLVNPTAADGENIRESVPTLTPTIVPDTADKESINLVFQFLKMDPTLLKQIQEILDKILMSLLPYFKDTILQNISKIYEFNKQKPPEEMMTKINKILLNKRTRYFQNIGKWMKASGFSTEAIPKLNELLTQVNARFTLLLSHQKTMVEFLEQHLPRTEFDELMQMYYMQPEFLNFVYFNNSDVNDGMMSQLQLATFKSFMHHRFVDAIFTTPYQMQLKTLMQLDGPQHNVTDVRELYMQRRGLPFAAGKAAEEIKKLEQAEGQRMFIEARMLNVNKEADLVKRLEQYKGESSVSQTQYLDAYYSQSRPACGCSTTDEIDLYIKFETLNKLPKIEQLKQVRQETPVFKKIYEYRKNLTCNPCNYDEMIAAEEKLVADRQVGEIYKKMRLVDKGSAEYSALEAQLKGLQPGAVTAVPVTVAEPVNSRVAIPFTAEKPAAKPSILGSWGKSFGFGGRRTKKQRARRARRLSARVSS